MDQPLSLSEKILLLSVRPEKGGFLFATQGVLDYAVTGALILDLVMAGNLRFEVGKLVLNSSHTDVPAGGYLLERIAKVGSPKTSGYWLKSILLSRSKIRKLVLDQLVGKREVRLESRRFLFFTWNVAFLRSGHQATRIIAEIRSTLMRGNGTEEQLYFISLLEPNRLLRRVYPEGCERRKARQRIKATVTANQVSVALRNVVQAANAFAALGHSRS